MKTIIIKTKKYGEIIFRDDEVCLGVIKTLISEKEPFVVEFREE